MSDRSESGFTLIEVLVTTVVLGLIIGPMTAAIILGFKTEGTVSERLTTSQGRFLLNVYLPRDAMQAAHAYGSSSGTIPFASTCAGQNTPGQSPSSAAFISPVSVPLVLTWTAQTTSTDGQGHVALANQSYEVDYVSATEPGHVDGNPNSTGDWLWRYVFTTTTSYSAGQPASGCALVPGSSTLITRDIDRTAGATGTVTNNAEGLLSVSLQYTDSAGNVFIASGGARA